MVATPVPIAVAKGQVATRCPLTLGSTRRLNRSWWSWSGCCYILVIALVILFAETFGVHLALLGLLLGGDDGRTEHGGVGGSDWAVAAADHSGAAREPKSKGPNDDL